MHCSYLAQLNASQLTVMWCQWVVNLAINLFEFGIMLDKNRMLHVMESTQAIMQAATLGRSCFLVWMCQEVLQLVWLSSYAGHV